MAYVLEVVNTQSDQVFSRTEMGEVSEEEAVAWESNVNAKLDFTKYHTRLVKVEEQEG